MKCIIGIYCIENMINQKKYIGQSVDIEDRIKHHFNSLKRNDHENKHLQASYNLYGKEAFRWHVVEECEKEILNDREKYWIKELDTYNTGYNMTLGGSCPYERTTSEEYREKMRQLVMGENNPNYGHYWTDEMKQNLSRKIKESGSRKGIKNARATKIICVETLEVFDYIEIAAQKFGFKSQSSISIALGNKSRTAGIYHFVYYSDEMYEYLINNQFEYLCDCYSASKNQIMYADITNKKFIRKSELVKIICSICGIGERKAIQFLDNNKQFIINQIEYKLLYESHCAVMCDENPEYQKKSDEDYSET